ncbi:hypothetical protein BH23BAC1_BH23BAC1_21090 [soil metagenome]
MNNMTDEVLVKVERVSKKFCKDLKTSLWYGLKDLGSELLGQVSGKELRDKEFYAINDVSFELKRGECLGLMGHNGAGKSTLLKMLNGLIKPDAGKITMKGRTGALIELGAGFNPLLTGRENVYINGQVLGFAKKEIDQKFDAIVDFAEIHDFIDTPVQNYSSGMKVRLGFAIAAQMEPDILLVDEVLAVGDVGFRIKCYNEIYRIMKTAGVIFVSHSMPQVGKVCTRGILLKDGQIRSNSSNTSEVIAEYYNSFGHEKMTTEGSGRAKIHNIEVFNNDMSKKFSQFNENSDNHFGFIDSNKSIKIKIGFSLDADVTRFNFLLSITDSDQKLVSQIIPFKENFENKEGIQTILIEIKDLILNTGKYSLTFHILQEAVSDWGEALIGLRSAIKFSVKRDRFIGSAPILHHAEWILN